MYKETRTHMSHQYNQLLKMILPACLLFTLLSTVHSSKVIGLKDAVGQLVWSDKGATSSKDFHVFNPSLPPGGAWKMLGQRCQLNYKSRTDVPIRRYREPTANANAYFRKPDGFQFIWDDRGSTVKMDGSVWRVACPQGFVSLGDFFYRANKITSPSALYRSVACVKLELVEDCVFGGRIWHDKGTWAKMDLSVWEVKASANQIAYFYCNNNHAGRPGLKPKCLKKSAITELMLY